MIAVKAAPSVAGYRIAAGFALGVTDEKSRY